MKTRVCLVYGGKSAEHEVSLQTAKAVIKALDPSLYEIHPIYISIEGEWQKGPKLEGPVEEVKQLQYQNEQVQPLSLAAATEEEGYDIIFPLLHGPNGEDGTVQGMLELLNLPYVGNGVLSSAAGMDKVIMKNLFAQSGLDQVKYTWFIRSEWKANVEAAYEKVEAKLGYPCFVKPANLGSSVGISKASNREELVAAFEEAFQFDRKIIIEEGVVAREIEVGVLGNDEPACSVIGEIVPKTDFYDYNSKYVDGNTAMIIPAELPEGVEERMKEQAICAFKSLDCSGLVRADFFLTKDQRLMINEVNTMPGFTPFSMFPLLWKEAGVSYPELIKRLIDLGVERHQEKQQIKHTK
ncbi:D-alanine--D-alanine ligase [Bacillus coahuilensis p1.1.43]|uniref:D-alanine--D-alanine ligase n=1 Tax=Bacillus coahuilensis p1.1.43 TaxID=1150625 RepID=A0A147K5I9_9BACI|nr:D-alanine--D-alanine ligase [Bacillus coahuilensis]KUP04889.1 D-alanine--D-alanine ligase [Bacillus coahuilensis p1.1.43]